MELVEGTGGDLKRLAHLAELLARAMEKARQLRMKINGHAGRKTGLEDLERWLAYGFKRLKFQSDESVWSILGIEEDEAAWTEVGREVLKLADAPQHALPETTRKKKRAPAKR